MCDSSDIRMREDEARTDRFLSSFEDGRIPDSVRTVPSWKDPNDQRTPEQWAAERAFDARMQDYIDSGSI